MGVLDDIVTGPEGDGNEDLDNERDDDFDDDEGDDDEGEGDDRKPDDKAKRRRNRPGAQTRDRNRIRNLEGQLSKLVSLIEKGGLGANAPKDDGKSVDVDALRREIESDVSAKANARVIRSEARAALKEAGFRGDVRRGVRMLELEGIDPDDGDALLDEIDALKEDSPELFGRVRRSRSTRDADDDTDDGYRSRESNRPARSRERMTRERGSVPESDGLAENLLRAVGGARRDR
jgi:hypothetical protein